MITGVKKTVLMLKKLMGKRGTQTYEETPSIGEVMFGECVTGIKHRDSTGGAHVRNTLPRALIQAF